MADSKHNNPPGSAREKRSEEEERHHSSKEDDGSDDDARSKTPQPKKTTGVDIQAAAKDLRRIGPTIAAEAIAAIATTARRRAKAAPGDTRKARSNTSKKRTRNCRMKYDTCGTGCEPLKNSSRCTKGIKIAALPILHAGRKCLVLLLSQKVLRAFRVRELWKASERR